MQRLVDATHSFKQFDLYTSNEAFGEQAEYIRDGLVWDTWLGNIHKFLQEGNVREFHMMMTINALSLFSLPEFMDEMVNLKEQYGKHFPTMSFNILRFPSFQSIVTLPTHIRNERADALEKWIADNKDNPLVHDMEIDGIKRLIEYTRVIKTGHAYTSSEVTRHRDFKTFYAQYDLRRHKSLDVFPKILTDWVDSIPNTDSSIMELAYKEGWVLKPDNKNIDEALATYE